MTDYNNKVKNGPVHPQIRRRARERAMQFLFGLEFTQDDSESALPGFWLSHPARPSVRDYTERLVRGVISRRDELDEAIAANLENWSPERVGRIERNVLRIALFEMRYATDVPRNVAINEAIEIAKTYGADDAPRFVNGVLDRLKECPPREPDL